MRSIMSSSDKDEVVKQAHKRGVFALIVAAVMAAFNVYASLAGETVYPFIFVVVGYLVPAGLFMLITGIDHDVVREKRAPKVAGMAMVGVGVMGVMIALIGNLLYFGRLF